MFQLPPSGPGVSPASSAAFTSARDRVADLPLQPQVLLEQLRVGPGRDQQLRPGGEDAEAATEARHPQAVGVVRAGAGPADPLPDLFGREVVDGQPVVDMLFAAGRLLVDGEGLQLPPAGGLLGAEAEAVEQAR